MGLLRSISLFALLSKSFLNSPRPACCGPFVTFAASISNSAVEHTPTMIVYDEVTSTMDKAKDLLYKRVEVPDEHTADRLNDDIFAVVAKHQSNGRGTRGRTWKSANGNLYMTLVIRKSKLPIPLTLVPLRIGTLIAPAIRKRVSNVSVYLKWPNDVLIGNKKVCGTLIEIEDDRMLIGIGCNVAVAPEMPAFGADKGRQSTSVKEHMGFERGEKASESGELALGIAEEIFASTRAWLDAATDSAEYVVNEFESNMESGAVQTLRSGDDEGREVIPTQVNPDGTLLVHFVDNKFMGKTLVADYLW